MPFTFTAESALSLIDTPVNLWPREAREAAQHEIARYCHEVRRTNDTLEEARLNSNHALLHEGVSDYWGSTEWTTHTAFRNAVRDGSFVPRFDQPTPTLTAAGDDKARARQADALAVMRRREAMALADRTAAETRIRDLEHRLSVALATPTVAPVTPVPWGPNHPDWMPFWRQAAADAEAAGNCSEYDRHAREMGGPSRETLRWDGEGISDGRRKTVEYTVDVDVRVSLRITVTAEDGDLDTSVVADALDGYSFGDAEYDSVYDYSVYDERTTSEHGEGVYWSAPEA